MKNTQIAKVFQNIADLLEIKADDRFKIRAYERVAQAIEHSPREIESMLAEGESLRDIPGVGDAIEKKIIELATTGKLEYFEKLKADFSPGIIGLLDIPGIGPKTAQVLISQLGINSIDDLESAIKNGDVAKLPHIGEKKVEAILHGIETLRHKDRRIPIGNALPIIDDILGTLQKLPGVKNLTAAGSVRRFAETVGDIDLMGTADDPETAIKVFVSLPQVKEILGQGPTKASVILNGGLQADLRIVEHDAFGSLLQHFTGSKQHNIDLRQYALKKGLSLSEYGITDINTGTIEKFTTEESFYARLGLQYIQPEIREGGNEILLAEKKALPRLITGNDVRGDLHVHTDWSDGSESLEAIVSSARKLGYSYIAITDHSAGLGIAHGLDEGRIKKQMQEIRKLNEQSADMHIFSGIEVNIKADGSLDLPDKMLAQLDIVIAAIHSAMHQDTDTITGRMIKAIENPHVDIIAHPTCRLIGEREPVAIDMETLFQAAPRHRKILEINCTPSRLDLKDSHVYTCPGDRGHDRPRHRFPPERAIELHAVRRCRSPPRLVSGEGCAQYPLSQRYLRLS